MKKCLFATLTVLFVFSAILFADDPVPTLKLSNWTNLQSEKSVVARGTIKDKPMKSVEVYARPDGGGTWQKIGSGTTADDKKCSFAIELDGSSLEDGKNWAKVVYKNDAQTPIGVESGLKALWVKDERLSLTRPYDKQAARIRKLEAELAKYKKGDAKATVTKPQTVKAVKSGQKVIRLGAEETTNNATTAEYYVQIASGTPFEKFGIVVAGKWQEHNSGTEMNLVPGEYILNAVNANGMWAYDSQSMSTGQPNFTLMINGVSLVGAGHNNGIGGANAKFQLNNDGTITPL